MSMPRVDGILELIDELTMEEYLYLVDTIFSVTMQKLDERSKRLGVTMLNDSVDEEVA
jgi:hypothetical protein